MTAGGFWAGAEVIHSYSREQAIEDGVLVDVTETAREAGFTWPVAMTRAAFEDCVAWGDADGDETGAVQDEAGRLWDVLWMARLAARRGGDRTTYELLRVPRHRRTGGRALKARLVLHAGPGDLAEPVLTIMLPGED